MTNETAPPGTRYAESDGLAMRAGLHPDEVETTGEKVNGMAVHAGFVLNTFDE